MPENTEPISNAMRLWGVLEPVFTSEEVEMDDAVIDRMVETIATIAAPTVSGTMHGGENVQVSYSDLDGLRAAWKDWFDSFARIRFEIEEVEELGDNVLVFVSQVGTTRHGVDLTQPSAGVFKFSDGALVVIEFHLDRVAASESAAQPA